MKKRIVLLTTLAALLAAALALSGVAQARPIAVSADAKCAKEAIKTLGPSFNPSNYTFHGGTEAVDNFTGQGTAGHDVFCGFGSDRDFIPDWIDTLDVGDIFIGGADRDFVDENYGTFYGGEDSDAVGQNFGTFYGQEGDDDYVITNEEGATFYGGAGDDSVFVINSGTFYGGAGADYVGTNFGTFDGGEGADRVADNFGGGCLINVEIVDGGYPSSC